MKRVEKVASYLIQRYEAEYNEKLDKVKLQALLYFAQRESFIQADEPLFDAIIYGHGKQVIIKEVEKALNDGTLYMYYSDDSDNDETFTIIMDNVMKHYAKKSPQSLYRLIWGQICWKRMQKNQPEQAIVYKPIYPKDIIEDAEKIKERIKVLGFLNLYDE